MSKLMFIKITETKSPFDIVLQTGVNNALLKGKTLAKIIEIKK